MARLGCRDEGGIRRVREDPMREADEVEELIQPLIGSPVSQTSLDQLKGLLEDGSVWLIAPPRAFLVISPQKQEV